LFLSNAAGGLNPEFKIGRLMVLTDQLNFTGVSPLTGPNDEAYGLRFPDMSCPFDRKLISLAEETARELNLPLERGIYVGVHGPELETRAETRFYRSLGADAIGMSSVLEVICARHLGLRVLAFSIIANLNLPDCMQEILLEDVLAASGRAEADLLQLWQRILPKLLPK
ncbi:MAG: purine-nucleoside phosphorylase, partial [Desulfovibrio sp.]|nr:purine-nucleoside phosphorylase [Desulfovibrio sp.]